MNPAKTIIRLAMVVLLGSRAIGAASSQPNFIIILTDSQGYHDVGFNGSKDILTPNIDSIASNGVRFTSGYVTAPLSTPSHAGLMVWRYQERFGLKREIPWQPNNPDLGLPLTETTLADVLGKAGYHSGMIGKWHLGCSPALHPLNRGFDEFFGFVGAGHSYLAEKFTIDETAKAKTEDESYRLWLTRNYELVKTTNYLTDEFSDEAVHFIERNKAKPFFLYLAYNAPQTPLEATEKYLVSFPRIQGAHRRTYAAMLSAVDDGVGRILAELSKDGLEEQTLVVYLSNTGGPLELNSSDNYPFRGAKDSPWEGGWHVPFAWQWPGHLPGRTIYDEPVLSLDIFATFAAVVDAPSNPQRPLDGVNLLPYLTGLKSGAPHDAIFMRLFDRGAFAVRGGNNKLVIPGTDQPAQLYNLAADISECKNVAETGPDIVQELDKKRLAWLEQMRMPGVPKLNQPPSPGN